MPTKTVLKLGSSGPEVKNLQDKLRKASYLVPNNGVFDTRTQTVVVVFQQQRGLVADGIVGEKTWAALDAPVEKFFRCGKVQIDVQTALQMCPEAPPANVEKFLPEILAGLEKRGLAGEA